MVFAGSQGLKPRDMDHLLEAYASSSSDDIELEEKAPVASALGELPPELHSIFNESGEI